jgi:hypothetical protein
MIFSTSLAGTRTDRVPTRTYVIFLKNNQFLIVLTFTPNRDAASATVSSPLSTAWIIGIRTPPSLFAELKTVWCVVSCVVTVYFGGNSVFRVYFAGMMNCELDV